MEEFRLSRTVKLMLVLQLLSSFLILIPLILNNYAGMNIDTNLTSVIGASLLVFSSAMIANFYDGPKIQEIIK